MAFEKAIEGLREGRFVNIKPKGNSMMPLIRSGQSVLLRPLGVPEYEFEGEDWEVDDIVLCKVKGSIYLHKITAIDGDRIQIGNNRGGINGWTTRNNVYGKAWLNR